MLVNWLPNVNWSHRKLVKPLLSELANSAWSWMTFRLYFHFFLTFLHVDILMILFFCRLTWLSAKNLRKPSSWNRLHSKKLNELGSSSKRSYQSRNLLVEVILLSCSFIFTGRTTKESNRHLRWRWLARCFSFSKSLWWSWRRSGRITSYWSCWRHCIPTFKVPQRSLFA